MATPTPSLQRKPRLLWANPFCLLDTASGASMAVREMLIQLAKNGYEVMVIGATIFDSEKGTFRLRDHWKTIEEKHNKVIKVNDGVLTHHLVATRSIVRNQMTAQEEGTWYGLYIKALKEFKPDLVYFYGGQTLDMLISDEAHARGIPAVAYLANGNYQGTRWCRDVDLIITDSQATADMYKETQGFSPVPVGAFIDPGLVVAEQHERKHLLLVNPSLQKGAGVVIQMAVMLEKRRPDILFEVVESRGNWRVLVQQVTRMMGDTRESLDNVIVTPNTDDMRPIYGRARLLLAPSLWWESFGRVAAEAMMNGIPAIVTNRGGLPEVIGDAGLKITFPAECYEKPFTKLPKADLLEPLLQRIEDFYDDDTAYRQYVARAFEQGKHHRIETSVGRLMKALAPLVGKQAAGGSDQYAVIKHKQLESGTITPMAKTPRHSMRSPENVHEKFLQYIGDNIEFSSLDDAPKKLFKNLRLSLSWRLSLLKAQYLKHYDSKVKAGPLVGLDFTLEQADGCILPKLMGCYEQKLSPFIKEAMGEGYTTVVDIGCAEGYYAVGLAKKLPQAKVYAHDINPKAQKACHALAVKNGVEQRVFVEGVFNGERFSELAPRETLIICDIEGAEKELLDPEAYPNLKNLDVIVEAYDCYYRGLSTLLADRFKNSHDVKIVNDHNDRVLEWSPEWYPGLSNLDQLLMVWEMREGPTPWVVLKAKRK